MAQSLAPPLAVVDGVATIAAPSELLVGNRRELKDRIVEAFDAGAREVQVDLAGTGYIDASGLGVLVSAQRAGRRIAPENRLVFLHANDDLVTLFEITKLDTIFEMRP